MPSCSKTGDFQRNSFFANKISSDRLFEVFRGGGSKIISKVFIIYLNSELAPAIFTVIFSNPLLNTNALRFFSNVRLHFFRGCQLLFVVGLGMMEVTIRFVFNVHPIDY